MGCCSSAPLNISESRSHNADILTVLDVYFEAMVTWPRDKRGAPGPPWMGEKFPKKGDSDRLHPVHDIGSMTIIESNMEIGLDNKCKRVRFKTEWTFTKPGAEMTGQTETIFESTGPESCQVTKNVTLTIQGCCLKCMRRGVENAIKKHLSEGKGMLADKLQNKMVGKQIGTNEWNRISNQGDCSSMSASNEARCEFFC